MKALFALFIELFYLLYSTNQYFFTLYIMVQDFMKIYIASDDRKIYMDDDGSGVFPKIKNYKLCNEKYQKTHSN